MRNIPLKESSAVRAVKEYSMEHNRIVVIDWITSGEYVYCNVPDSDWAKFLIEKEDSVGKAVNKYIVPHKC